MLTWWLVVAWLYEEKKTFNILYESYYSIDSNPQANILRIITELRIWECSILTQLVGIFLLVKSA